ncbi:RNA polymerase sigma factor [Kribbella sp. CA-293567]|uniref:RNA polymerase sigma factor n=1 Tax=Kribbella sp. CA-293567 TaxID=3002436 RepID=UPI0022DD79E8|nr:sigma-70 family RNA polymerase sigma factor [Kribbella sp. CA-293567]WBQ02965.1 sigma-70 family RNA polymerase sigma factor [Kribbella sp. CA-293567]
MHRLRLGTADDEPLEVVPAESPPDRDQHQLAQPPGSSTLRRTEAAADPEPPLQLGETPEDFARLFDRYATRIHRYVARRLSRTEADDLVGQTFLIAFERRHRYADSPTGALPLLYGIATNLIHRKRRDEVRQYRAYARSEPAGTDQYDDPLATEVAARVDAATANRLLTGVLAGLNQGERDVLLLYAWEDLSYTEIAEALKLPIGTVSSRLYRARRALRSALGSDFEGNQS